MIKDVAEEGAGQSKIKILRRKEVEARTGLCRSTLYFRIKHGNFPKPIRLGGSRTAGWIESEINAWLKQCLEKSRSEILDRAGC